MADTCASRGAKGVYRKAVGVRAGVDVEVTDVEVTVDVAVGVRGVEVAPKGDEAHPTSSARPTSGIAMARGQ
jgi:hypothetical protein